MFRPKVRLVLGQEPNPAENSDRIVTKRLRNGETAAYVRVRVVNDGRTTARNVAVNILRVDRWDPERREWIRSRPELDGRPLQPSNQLENQPDLVDVFPHTHRILDLSSIDLAPSSNGADRIFVEISQPRPPNEANVQESATWRLELLVCGDNSHAVTILRDALARRDLVTVERRGDLGPLRRPGPANEAATPPSLTAPPTHGA